MEHVVSLLKTGVGALPGDIFLTMDLVKSFVGLALLQCKGVRAEHQKSRKAMKSRIRGRAGGIIDAR
jgi:hypothetical protein